MQPVILAPTDRLSRHYSRRVEQILSRFNDIRELIDHEGSKGARVEQEVRKFLLEFLPKRYEYGSGIVIDSSGGESDRSRQEDVLVLDKFFSPRLFLDEEPNVYPVEVVYCGIEVKTSIDAPGLKQAIDNIASLKRLKFVSEPYTDFHYNLPIIRETTGPLGFIFAFDTPIKGVETLLQHFTESIGNIEPSARPDFICILNRGLIGIGSQTGKPQFHLYGLLGKNEITEEIGEMVVFGGPSCNEFPHPVTGQRYPLMIMKEQYYAVDVARTFIGFLGNLYEMLLSKRITGQSNLLKHYIPEQMTRYAVCDYEP